MSKMRKTTKRVVVFGLALATTLAAAQGVAACSPYISGWVSGPFSGHLLGTRTVTVKLGGEGLGLNASITESFQVGVYQDGGRVIEVRCDTYEPYLL